MTDPAFSVEGVDERGWLVIRVDGKLFTVDEISRFLDRLLAARPAQAG